MELRRGVQIRLEIEVDPNLMMTSAASGHQFEHISNLVSRACEVVSRASDPYLVNQASEVIQDQAVQPSRSAFRHFD